MGIIIDMFQKIFLIFFGLLSVFVNLQALYYLFLSFFGFGEAKRDYKRIGDQTRFLILVAAHNEETVIGSSPNYCVNSPLIDNMDLMT